MLLSGLFVVVMHEECCFTGQAHHTHEQGVLHGIITTKSITKMTELPCHLIEGKKKDTLLAANY